MRKTLITLAAVAALAPFGSAWAGVAASFSLSLEGDVIQLATNNFISGGKVFDTGELQLSEKNNNLPTFQQGFQFDLHITLLNGPFVIPASPEQLFGVNFLNSASNSTPSFNINSAQPVISANLTFLLGGIQQGPNLNGNCGNCASIITSPGTGMFQFDEIVVMGSFQNLTAPYVVNGFSLSYQLSQPVPEPGAWLLLLGGLGVVVAAGRPRGQSPQLA